MATRDERPTVRYSLKIECYWDDSGDYMGNATIPEFFKWAEEQGRNLTVLVKEGTLDPKPVQARISVQGVTLLPRTS